MRNTYFDQNTHKLAQGDVFRCQIVEHSEKSQFFAFLRGFLINFTLKFTIFRQNTTVFKDLWRKFLWWLRWVIEFLTSDLGPSHQTAFRHIFFWNLPPRFQSPTKVRHSVTPECEKFRQIWLHQSMRRKKLYIHIQTWNTKASYCACRR